MRDFLFRKFCLDKDGKLNYDRASKYFGFTKSDMYFMCKNTFEYLDTPTLMYGVQVGYHPTSKNPMFFAPWVLKTCYHSTEDLSYIRRVIENQLNIPPWATYEYFIMDVTGRIRYKSFDISQTIDENGVIHLKNKSGDLNHFVYPADRKKYGYKKIFCYGRDIPDLNSHIISLSEKKIIKKPKHFKKGFPKTPESPLTKDSFFEKQ